MPASYMNGGEECPENDRVTERRRAVRSVEHGRALFRRIIMAGVLYLRINASEFGAATSFHRAEFFVSQNAPVMRLYHHSLYIAKPLVLVPCPGRRLISSNFNPRANRIHFNRW